MDTEFHGRGATRVSKTKFLVFLGATSILAGWSGTAFAEDDAAIRHLEAEIHRIEMRHQEEISALRAEIHHLRHTGAPLYVTKGEPLTPSPGPHVIETSKGPVHFGFSDADQQNTVELTGRLHIDTGGYLGVHPDGPSSKLASGLASGVDFRRARIGVQGIFLGDWAYGLIFDLGGSSDGYSPTASLAAGNTLLPGGSASGIENAFITYNGFYKHGGPFPVAFDIGAIDVPWTLDEPMGSNDIMFMERSSSQVIATAFGGGDNRTALGLRSNNDRYWIGAYLTGPTTGAWHEDGTVTGLGTGLGPQFAALGRATYQLYQDNATNASLHIGANFADTFDPRAGINTEGLSLSDRPELRIDPTSIIGTGTVPAHNGEVFGGEAAASYGNAFIQGEYYHYIIDTKTSLLATALDGPAVDFNGGYVQGSYTFGGRRYYKPTTGAYSGVIPDHPFIYGTGGWGALEVAGRFSVVDLNTADPGKAPILGGEQTTYGAGLNWYPNNNMRFMLDYEHVIEDLPVTLGGPSTKGGTIDWIAARSQVVF